MTATAKLLRLYLVDKQLRGLRSRLTAAETYLAQQDKLLSEIDARHAAILGQVRQLEATLRNDENEVASMDSRSAMLRERMNNAKTSKEHSALLTEISTIKADKAPIETRMLEAMSKVEALRAQAAQVETERADREAVRKSAVADRDARRDEIKDRVAELEAERAKALEDVPPPALRVYEERLALGAEDVMAPVEEQDRRNLEYTCAACYTHLPIEQVSVLLHRGDLTRCPTCHAILYIEQALRENIADAKQKSSTKKKGGKAAAVEDD
ncbi:MAG: hypothetical protein SFZ24_09775 [Planctomycetota bacterium]|nr:hypothetical protein [Planctomycetota bacterium]